MVVLITGLAVASRTLSGVYSAVFQQDSRRSREAAELGINRIVAELNRERNRGLLATNPAAGGFWTQAEADASKNACAVRANVSSRPTSIDLNLIRSGGVPGTTTANPIIYVADDGTLTADTDNAIDATRPANQRYAYQLVTSQADNTIRVNPIAGPDPNPASATFGQLNQVGAINLQVRGYSYNNGRLSGSVVVDQQLEVLPKCCGRSLAQFGNDLRSCTVGTGPGFGFLIGVGENTVGDADLNGSKSELDNGTTPINPVVCLGTAGTTCPADVSVGSTTVPVVSVLRPASFPDVEIWPAALGAAPTPGTLTTCKKDSTGCSATAGAFRTETGSGSNTLTTINVNTATSANLPTYCKSSANDPSAGINTIHCNLTELAIDGDIAVNTSASSRLKLYFSTEGNKVTSSGSSQLRHVNQTSGATDAQKVLQLQMFGCREAASPSKGCVGDASNTDVQSLTLNGNSGTAADPYFLYFPLGNFTFNGGGGTGDQFNGVLWANVIQGNGNVQINVPGSGVNAILSQYGVVDSSGTGVDEPLLWDYVTRAVRSFRLLPGS
ncbi:hypothetical protein [Synechococcus sp. Cruz-7E5]|uniref:hypothetical protein n=1 Tax=Synechococcus sp. Cruz-7E5 TaxID=2823730 RepID=UPI0020CEDC38|nr:hypothetical protein [Synechococcus sp. Cruz-7E5]MCP9856808.1 hypothetical protein [Synechococcus sp. Cruz-9C9]MCP9871362.1 hypothetical protein [Synechococcus sp. Cruz-7B9]